MRATCKTMLALALGPEGSQNPYIVQLAKRVVSHLKSKDQTSEAYAVRDFIGSTVRFINETGERLQTPIITAGWDGSQFDPYSAAGDCDCQTILLAAMLAVLGIQFKLLVVSTAPDREYSHVLLVAKDKRKSLQGWFPLDCTRNTDGMQDVTAAAIYDYGKLNELATSQWAKPNDVGGMAYQPGVLMRNTYTGLGCMGDSPRYLGRGGRATFGDGTLDADITNILEPIAEGAGLRIAGATTTATLYGGASIGPAATTGIPPLAGLGSGASGAAVASVATSPQLWILLAIGAFFLVSRGKSR